MAISDNTSLSERDAVLKHPSASVWPSVEIASDGEGPAEEEWKPSKHEKAIIYVLAFLNLIVSLDASIIVTSLNTISRDLGATTTQAFWIGTSYLLVNAVTMPMMCSVSDIIGRPICLTFSIAVFTLGTILCCTAQNITVMLVGRCIQGVGGGGIHSLGLVIHTDFVPLRWRPKWYSVTLAAWAVGLSIGPVTGGSIAQRTTWRWIFYLMFPICGFGLIVVPYLLTLRPKQATIQEKLKRIDWLGGFVFTSSATAFLLAVSWGGSQYSWDSAATLVPLILGTVGLIAVAFYVAYIAKYPFIPGSLFRDVSSIITYICAFFQGMLLYGQLYYCPFYLMAVKRFTPINAGVATLSNLLTFAIASIITGRLVTRVNNFRWAIWVGWFFSSVGAAMYIIWRVNDSAPVWVIGYVISGLSHGAVLTAQNFGVQAMCKPGDEGAAATMYIFARQFGMAIGVGTGASTFQNAMKLKLRWDGLPTDIADRAEVFYMREILGLADSARDAVYDAYKFGFQIVFATWLGISVLALFLTLVFVKHADMNRKLDTEHRIDSTRMFRHWARKQSATNGVGK
ncbi:major facilitator superfamily transporter [Daldinia eschscholtzii]|nr:major facilitator superfamily transporter [Daldinia eschscholtzii]